MIAQNDLRRLLATTTEELSSLLEQLRQPAVAIDHLATALQRAGYFGAPSGSISPNLLRAVWRERGDLDENVLAVNRALVAAGVVGSVVHQAHHSAEEGHFASYLRVMLPGLELEIGWPANPCIVEFVDEDHEWWSFIESTSNQYAVDRAISRTATAIDWIVWVVAGGPPPRWFTGEDPADPDTWDGEEDEDDWDDTLAPDLPSEPGSLGLLAAVLGATQPEPRTYRREPPDPGS